MLLPSESDSEDPDARDFGRQRGLSKAERESGSVLRLEVRQPLHVLEEIARLQKRVEELEAEASNAPEGTDQELVNTAYGSD